MSLVNIKCPNCGASIQLDNSRESGFCSYCGSKVQIQEAINKIKIDRTGDIKIIYPLDKLLKKPAMGKKHATMPTKFGNRPSKCRRLVFENVRDRMHAGIQLPANGRCR